MRWVTSPLFSLNSFSSSELTKETIVPINQTRLEMVGPRIGGNKFSLIVYNN
jgi:hypothetical protein